MYVYLLLFATKAGIVPASILVLGTWHRAFTSVFGLAVEVQPVWSILGIHLIVQKTAGSILRDTWPIYL